MLKVIETYLRLIEATKQATIKSSFLELNIIEGFLGRPKSFKL